MGLATGLLVASTVVGVGSAVVQTQAASKAAKVEKDQAKQNAAISNKLAADALKRGKLKAQKRRSDIRSLEAEQKVAFAKSGVTLGVGSPLDVLLSTRDIGKLDEAIIKENAEREAKGFRAEGSRFVAESKLAESRESFAKQAGVLQTFSTVLGGASDIVQQ